MGRRLGWPMRAPMRVCACALLIALVATLGATPAGAEALGTLPRDLSPWGMFLAADIVVKAVMIGLVLASVLTWTIWIAKAAELAARRRAVRGALAKLVGAATLAEGAPLSALDGPPAAMIATAQRELAQSAGLDPAGITARLALGLGRIEAGAAQAAGRGMGVLATIGATAPFVGLFGTVWGIMNSFIGISRAQTTNLAVVAPGIAEALLATALGLLAAIPAVIIYNAFARSIAGYRAALADLSAELLRLAGRDLDRARTGR